MAQKRSGVGNGPWPQEPAVSLAQLHRNPPATGAQAHLCELLFSLCPHLEHTWFPAMLFLSSCRGMEGMVYKRHCYESRREGHDCKMDLLHKSPGKEVLLEVEKEKKSEQQHLAGRCTSGFCTSLIIKSQYMP